MTILLLIQQKYQLNQILKINNQEQKLIWSLAYFYIRDPSLKTTDKIYKFIFGINTV